MIIYLFLIYIFCACKIVIFNFRLMAFKIIKKYGTVVLLPSIVTYLIYSDYIRSLKYKENKLATTATGNSLD